MLDKHAAMEKILAPRSRSRVTLCGPRLVADGVVSDHEDPTVIGAIGQALRDFSVREGVDSFEAIREVRWVAVHRHDEVEGVAV